MPNPFAPKRPATPAPPPPVVPNEGVVEPSRAELDDMRKAELQALARERGLDDDGTKADLVDRLTR